MNTISFGCLSVGKPLQMSACRSGRIHNTLQFQRCDNIFALAVRVLVVFVQLDHIKACSHYNRAVLLCNDLVLLVIVDRAGLAYF